MNYGIAFNSDSNDFMFSFDLDEPFAPGNDTANLLTGCIPVTLNNRIHFMCHFTGTFDDNSTPLSTGDSISATIDTLSFEDALDFETLKPYSISKLEDDLSVQHIQSIKQLIVEYATYYWRGDFHLSI